MNENEILSPKEFKNVMLSISQCGDYETAHRAMDTAMANLLKKLGYHEGIEVFDKSEKWYA